MTTNLKINGFKSCFRFLSNFEPCVVEFDGHMYPTVEHAYQAAKTVNEAEREKVRICSTPGQAKRLSYKLTKRQDWDSVRVGIMEGLLRQKFSKGTGLWEALQATDGVYLEETNTWKDTFWGVCDGKGENVLGKLLMQIREETKL